MPLRFRFRVLLPSLLLGALACDGGTEPTPPRRVAALQLDASTPTSGYVGRSAMQAAVRAVDSAGHPVAGVAVRFRVTNPGSSLAAAADTTDVNGRAMAGDWQLATEPGVDTLVASAEGAQELRVPIVVRAGPVTRIETLAAATGTGTVMANMLTGPAFRLYDAYDHVVPTPDVLLKVQATPGTTARSSRLPLMARSDPQGIVSVSEWVPRHLGEHAMRAVAVDDPAVTSAVVRRTVASPACAPIGLVPDDLVGTTGLLGADPSQPCADSVDRWATQVETVALLRGKPFGSSATDRDLHRVVRAGSLADEDVIVPASREPFAVLLPPGEYETVVSRAAEASGSVPYTVWGPRLTGEISAPLCSPAFDRGSLLYVMPPVDARVRTACRANFPQLGLVDAPYATLSWYGAGAAGRKVFLSVTPVDAVAPDGTTAGWSPRAIMSWVRADGRRETLVVPVPSASLWLDVPEGFVQVDLLVTASDAAGKTLRFDVRARAQ